MRWYSKEIYSFRFGWCLWLVFATLFVFAMAYWYDVGGWIGATPAIFVFSLASRELYQWRHTTKDNV